MPNEPSADTFAAYATADSPRNGIASFGANVMTGILSHAVPHLTESVCAIGVRWPASTRRELP